jgi:hypothetical protein
MGKDVPETVDIKHSMANLCKRQKMDFQSRGWLGTRYKTRGGGLYQKEEAQRARTNKARILRKDLGGKAACVN